ncbi:MAG: glycoside hydrolase family 9 protein [Firmicutes bacterium]|nr:glycoside hydrolase family 9 protein [Bacillota bacterium]
MKNCGRLRVILLSCLAAGLLSGCGEIQQEPGETEDSTIEKNPYAGAVSMEGTPVIDYTVPRFLPNILVDTRGYSADDRKQAAVKGRKLPEEFSLVDLLTGEEVYRGVVEEVVYHDELGLYSGYLDFSDFGQTGSYYLECDIIGCSTSFDIQEKCYTDLFAEVYGVLADDIRRKGLVLSEAVDLLEAYEWYGTIFPDQDEDEIPDVLKELQGWISYMEENGVEEEDEALYAAFLAKFSYNYQKFDRGYATDCLKRASTVFGQAKEDTGRDSDVFFALTELYRATGRYAYRKQITARKSFFADNSSYLEERSYLYGVMTYIATRQRVDVELCHDFTGNLMDRAEEISKHCSDMTHPVAARNDGSADLLKDAVELSFANYITNNYQYTEVMEDFLHYLMGRNKESVCFYENGEDKGGYLLLFAQLAALHEAGEE